LVAVATLATGAVEALQERPDAHAVGLPSASSIKGTPTPSAATTSTPQATPKPSASVSVAPSPTTKAPLTDQQVWASQDYSVARGANTSQRIVLSYDDCPRSKTAFREMVGGAEAQGVAIVLFPTGACLRAGLVDAAFARAHGHYVFNHSVSHPHLGTLSFDDALAELGGSGVDTTWGRPPYGDLSDFIRSVYRAKGMRIWLWTLDTLDWDGHKPAATVEQVVIAHAGASGTVLMHMQENAFNPDSLGRIKTGLAARGLELCRNQGATSQSPKTLSC